MNEQYVTVVNDDGTIKASLCKISQLFSKEKDGPITHVGVFWYDNWPSDEGATHVVPIENILYERGLPENARPIGRPEIVIHRLAISEQPRNAVYERDGYKCQICGKGKGEVALCLDHVFPFSKGGKTEYDNLQTLCKECNSGKRDTWLP
jgi:hypothetical protein